MHPDGVSESPRELASKVTSLLNVHLKKLGPAANDISVNTRINPAARGRTSFFMLISYGLFRAKYQKTRIVYTLGGQKDRDLRRSTAVFDDRIVKQFNTMKKTVQNLDTIAELKSAIRVRPVSIRIVTGSMEPVLKVGATYVLVRHHFDKLKRFDLIVFWNGEVPVAHYVWHINKEFGQGQVVTRSLQSPDREDLPVGDDMILGRLDDVRLSFWFRIKLILGAFRRSLLRA